MKIKASSTKQTSVKTTRGGKSGLGGSSKSPSPLMPKKSSKKAGGADVEQQISFGRTGLTGES